MTKPRAIFHLDGAAGLRGGERQLLYLAAALRARGRRSVVYARRDGELAREASRLALEVRALPFAGEWDLVSAARLAAAAKRDAAIVHAHTAHAVGLGALASLAGTPLVAHRRVDFPVSVMSARLKYGRAGKIVCVSKAIAEIMKTAGVPAEKLSVVPDGLPTDKTEEAWSGSAAGRFVAATAEEKIKYRQKLANEFRIDPDLTWIANLAALVPHKDHDTLIAAAVIVLLKRPLARFLIAGKGPEEVRLFESIRRMGLVGKVLLTGHVPDPLPLLKAVDIYVQSSWGEGMGSVLIEAAACGAPIAATTAGGIPEVIEDGVTGLLVSPRNPEALAEALIRLMDDKALASRLAAQGLKSIHRFGLKRMADDMEKIYDSVS
jgi:glycosyltransferase involved in cell wall biosynthesis